MFREVKPDASGDAGNKNQGFLSIHGNGTCPRKIPLRTAAATFI